jgi:hypothetical protein
LLTALLAIVVGCVSAVGRYNALDHIIGGIANTWPFIMLMQFTFITIGNIDLGFGNSKTSYC